MNYSLDNNISSSALRKRKTLKKSINFSIMIVGESGSGRSTLINTLCGGNSIVQTSSTINQDPFSRKLTLRNENVELEDNEGHKINLNIIDTPNFANQINCNEDFRIIVDFIRHQFDEVLLEESRVKRNPRFKDGRIHILIYLINPTGHGLSEIDIKFLKHINNLVNIIPIISKADSLTPSELKLNKTIILEDLNKYGINYYKFNEYEYESDYIDDEIIEYNKYLNSLLPFAVIGANEYRRNPVTNGTTTNDENEDVDDIIKLRVLNNELKPINIDNSDINDFTILKNVLLITHLNEFKDITHDQIYENYRTEALSGKTFQYMNKNNSDDEGSSRSYTTTSQQNLDLNGSNGHGGSNGNGYHHHHNHNSVNHNDKNNGQSSDYLMKEEQIKLEEERLKKFEERVHQDLITKRQELLERENELKEIEKRLLAEGLKLNENGDVIKVEDD
ncbi:CDC11 [Candida pseudojiufengensis]|uniref:CDC11 n=1 Tax=Candida pseudojiufengensis TaxID=497109 RepID=UPI0022240EDC|nr:CDC11 [Candida pseudojiufengensis]KAI5964143.1 CDC11 [Candida pseudojiufengensis]